MFGFLTENIGTVIIGLALAALVILVIRNMIKNKDHGMSCSGCSGCSSCSGCPGADLQKEYDKKTFDTKSRL